MPAEPSRGASVGRPLGKVTGLTWLGLLVTAVTLNLSGCSSGPQSETEAGSASTPSDARRIIPTAHLYDPDDLYVAGVKVARIYDVDGLPEAIAAVRVFLSRTEYEARFYENHAVAASTGAAAASLVTGESAIVTGANVPWSEGASDRRMCVGAINANCVAKYGDFVVLGNMVLMCEGRDSETALEACVALTSQMPPP